MVGVYDKKSPDEEGRGPAGTPPKAGAPEKTVGVYDRPKRKRLSPGLLVILVVALAVALLLIYRYAYGCPSTASNESAAAGSRAVDQSIELADKFGVELKETVSIVDVSTDQVRAIAACEERSAASERIS